MVNSIKNNYPNQNNYSINTNKQTSDKNQVKYTAEEEAKISAEEDAIYCEHLRKNGYTEDQIDYAKKHMHGFPPDNAPGSVRRAWRQAVENATPEMRDQLCLFICVSDAFMRVNPDYTSSIQNDTNGYFKVIEDLQTYIKQYDEQSDSQSKNQYKWYNEILKAFETELKKFA
ncbi:hypothetical protein [Clostridium cellulovorans]|uniref:Uncharacterized protein n=1 Tax=Clostridium cellulovorans (strain ATCC 35296 / DSM 3052 / OCM 3 / 743B) TaxID=573061 RepID=D9SP87_CLOC7|nr:hypothetical protein [Clostridium cellulovorans]ADL52052.1 hypothetical protein Clocel_2333 [Clostridium cellulovorans 743B]